MIDITVHRNVLINILKDIFTDAQVAPYLGFKGGTAAMLFYNLSRFSVDLDFDLLNDQKENEVYERIEEILKNYGQIEARKKRFSIFFMLSYHAKLEGAQKKKIEINKRSFGSRYEVKQYLGIPMQVMLGGKQISSDA